ncbi:MAG: DUF5063 domain-containing protein [Saprospiraceae bacterium]|nr:DUF5063 domain-containing protein [Saprospiraceae bacterium]
MPQDNIEIIKSKTVLEMITVAYEFCLFIESAENYDKQTVISYLQKVCPLIYIKGALLPEIEVSDESAAERFVTEENWESIFSMLKTKFGKDDEFYIIDDNLITGVKPIVASLADNLADVYQDLKDFVMLYQKNLTVAKECAVRDCKVLFENNWGQKLLNAHIRIHQLVFEETDEI